MSALRRGLRRGSIVPVRLPEAPESGLRDDSQESRSRQDPLRRRGARRPGAPSGQGEVLRLRQAAREYRHRPGRQQAGEDQGLHVRRTQESALRAGGEDHHSVGLGDIRDVGTDQALDHGRGEAGLRVSRLKRRYRKVAQTEWVSIIREAFHRVGISSFDDVPRRIRQYPAGRSRIASNGDGGLEPVSTFARRAEIAFGRIRDGG